MKLIYRLLLLLLFITTFSVLNAQEEDRGYIVKVGDKIPDSIIVKLTDGSVVNVNNLKGKIVLLQFTASWCSVCIKEMPHLENEVWKVYKDKGLVFVGIDRDEPIERVKEFKSKLKITYPLALDPGANIFAKFAHKEAGVTRNILIDKDGTIIYLTRLYDEHEFAGLKKKIAEVFCTVEHVQKI